MKVKLLPLFFTERNEREIGEYNEQMGRLREFYGDVAEFLTEQPVGAPVPKEADAVLFPQMIFAAFRHDDALKSIQLPMVVLTSRFGTVEMWDWEIVTYLRNLGLTVFSPYSIEMAKTVLRALGVKRSLKQGAKFLVFQDSPGEGMQSNIFKRFYWWEKQSIESMEETFGCRLIYHSWKELCEEARRISDDEARSVSADWDIEQQGVSEICFLKAVKIYVAVKRVIAEIGDVAGVGANCLNESFYCDTTPCLAWNMLFERDDIIFACEGDTLTLLDRKSVV